MLKRWRVGGAPLFEFHTRAGGFYPGGPTYCPQVATQCSQVPTVCTLIPEVTLRPVVPTFCSPDPVACQAALNLFVDCMSGLDLVCVGVCEFADVEGEDDVDVPDFADHQIMFVRP